MKMSVVIPTFNRRPLILQTLPTLLDQTFPADEYEVIVVVDGSTDGTAEAIKHIISRRRIRVLEQVNRGQSAAMNTGLRAAAGEVVLFVDDDHFCERTLLAQHAAAHAGYDGLVFGPVLVDPRSPDTPAKKWMQAVSEYVISHLKSDGVRLPWSALVAPNSSLRRDTLVAMGGFDERLPRAFENDLGLRLWKAGVGFRFCPAAIVRQYYTRSTDSAARREAPRQGAGEYLTCRRHPEFRRVSQLAGLAGGPYLRRKVCELGLRFSLPLDMPLKLAERLAWSSRRRGARIFGARQTYGTYRGAAEAAGGWTELRRDFGQLLAVLQYHRISPGRADTYPPLTVKPERFRRQMAWLKRKGYMTIGPGDWLAWCSQGKPLPPKPLLITFDDAYEDLVEYALPLLREYSFKATVFVVTGEIGGRNSWDERRGSDTIRCMSEEQIRYWSGQGIEFGAHGRTHSDLTTLSADKAAEEVAGSAHDLAQILGSVPRSFAYPHGMFNEAVRRYAAEVFPVAFSGDEGLNELRTDLHELRRTMVQPTDSLPDFILRVRFGSTAIERIMERLGLRRRVWELE